MLEENVSDVWGELGERGPCLKPVCLLLTGCLSLCKHASLHRKFAHIIGLHSAALCKWKSELDRNILHPNICVLEMICWDYRVSEHPALIQVIITTSEDWGGMFNHEGQKNRIQRLFSSLWLYWSPSQTDNPEKNRHNISPSLSLRLKTYWAPPSHSPTLTVKAACVNSWMIQPYSSLLNYLGAYVSEHRM